MILWGISEIIPFGCIREIFSQVRLANTPHSLGSLRLLPLHTLLRHPPSLGA